MREIKFRGKSKKDGTWFYGNLFDKDTRGNTHIYTTKSGCLDVDPETVGQFTGRTDKNGKEIYEGDIVRWFDSDENERIDLVKWKFGGLVLCNAQYTVGSYGLIEVIGNIHDNPELIK